MTLIQKCSRIGAAAFALGLSLAGPQVGVAAAERGGGDGSSASGSHGRGGTSADPTPGAGNRNHSSVPPAGAAAAQPPGDELSPESIEDASAVAEVSLPETTVAEPDASQEPVTVDEALTVEEAVSTDEPKGDDTGSSEPEVGSVIDDPVAEPAVESEDTQDAAGETPAGAEETPDESVIEPVYLVDPVIDSGLLPQVVVPDDSTTVPSRGGPQPLPWWRTLTGTDMPDGEPPIAIPGSVDGSGQDEVDQPVWAYDLPTAGPIDDFCGDACTSAPVPVSEPTGTAAGGFQQAMAGLSAQVNRVLDDLSRFVASLPVNPFTEFLSGALLLVRRYLPNLAPTANPVQWGQTETAWQSPAAGKIARIGTRPDAGVTTPEEPAAPADLSNPITEPPSEPETPPVGPERESGNDSATELAVTYPEPLNDIFAWPGSDEAYVDDASVADIISNVSAAVRSTLKISETDPGLRVRVQKGWGDDVIGGTWRYLSSDNTQVNASWTYPSDNPAELSLFTDYTYTGPHPGDVSEYTDPANYAISEERRLNALNWQTGLIFVSWLPGTAPSFSTFLSSDLPISSTFSAESLKAEFSFLPKFEVYPLQDAGNSFSISGDLSASIDFPGVETILQVQRTIIKVATEGARPVGVEPAPILDGQFEGTAST